MKKNTIASPEQIICGADSRWNCFLHISLFFSYFENGGGWQDSEQRLFQVGGTVMLVVGLVVDYFFYIFFF